MKDINKNKPMFNDLTHYTADYMLSSSYFKLPKWLINPNVNISNDAKLLYTFLRDRVDLSIANKWIDSKGRVYIIYARESAMNALGVKKDKCSSLFAELKDAGLIKEKRRGLNKANLIYVMYPKSLYSRTTEKPKSRTLKFSVLDSDKSNENNTNIINTDEINDDVNNIRAKIKEVVNNHAEMLIDKFQIYPEDEINEYINEFVLFISNLDNEIRNTYIALDEQSSYDILLEYIQIKLKDCSKMYINNPIGYMISLIRKKGEKNENTF